MLNKKATELTNELISELDLSEDSYTFLKIQSIVLNALESLYVQARKDQADKVYFTKLPSGSLCFTDVAR